MRTKIAFVSCSCLTVLALSLSSASASTPLPPTAATQTSLSAFSPKAERVLSGPTHLSSDMLIDITPALEVKNTVQYITLGVVDAAAWHKGSEAGSLTDAAGKTHQIAVSLETIDGQQIALEDVSFGNQLMFSHLNTAAKPDESDLPKNVQFTKLHIKSSSPLMVSGIHWADISNK